MQRAEALQGSPYFDRDQYRRDDVGEHEQDQHREGLRLRHWMRVHLSRYMPHGVEDGADWN